MRYYIFRNTTIEPFFKDVDASFSGYEDISNISLDAENYIWFYLLPIRQDLNLLANEIDLIYNSLEFVVKQINPSKTLIIFTLETLYVNNIETSDFKLQESINNFNFKIVKLTEIYKNIKVIDIKNFYSNYPITQLIDWKYYYLSKTLLNPKLSNDFENWFSHELDTIQLKRKKCLVLDLDNTLWGGILGEDGLNNIKIGGDYPGNAYLEFQKSILELYKAGVILAVCSKNNETDVLEAWNKNPNIIIKKENLATYQINWDNKAQNISKIIKQLNIGADSVVFVDDNPSERELVKQFLPMVETPDFPSQPYMLPLFIKDISEKYFNIYKLTEEDKAKTQQYLDNAVRDEFKQGFSDFTEYLKSLEITIQIQKATELTIPRIAQMTQKTNQFNLTTKRYTEADIYSFIENKHWVYCISVKDRFGENGVTGLIIILIDENKKEAEIDSLLLSCRILGKEIEEIFTLTMLDCLKQHGYSLVKSTYIKTNKNEQVSKFYEKIGFNLNQKDSIEEEDTKKYTLDLMNFEFQIKNIYQIINDGN